MKRAMSTVKNIAAAAMMLAVVFGFAGFKPVTANAAQAAVPATASVEEENSYFEEDAYQRSFLTLVNNERAQAGLAPVALGDSNHNAAAMERAEELAVSYSYVRPNGGECHARLQGDQLPRHEAAAPRRLSGHGQLLPLCHRGAVHQDAARRRKGCPPATAADRGEAAGTGSPHPVGRAGDKLPQVFPVSGHLMLLQ